ncbi:MAG: hypothetical protein WA631_16710, partial [Nitrososphaeraceae archaeon]
MDIRNPPNNQLSLKIFLISLSLLPLLLMSGEFDDTDRLIQAATAASTDKSNTEDRCISYNSVEKTITIRCGTNNRLTDIHNTIQDRNVIDRLSDGIWLLNAGIIERGATLLMDPQDTKWLKIIADGKIDSVKVTSWNPLTNGYAISKG